MLTTQIDPDVSQKCKLFYLQQNHDSSVVSSDQSYQHTETMQEYCTLQIQFEEQELKKA
jgi:hypothetical protein